MTDNPKYLKQAREHIKKFETELEPERLREAYMALENVNLAQEHDPKVRAQLRTDSLFLWLELLRLLDHFLDPSFDPEDVPQKLVQPPPIPGGGALRPGADPNLIKDPKTRAEYEKAIADNRAKANNYRMQIQLRRLNESLPPRAETFIRNSFGSTPSDQEELETAIDKIIKNPERKENLLKLLTSSHP